MTTLRRRAVAAVQVVLVAAVLWFAWKGIHDNWGKIRLDIAALRPNWALILLSAAIVLSAYLLLIEAWRRLMSDSGARVAYSTSAHIWFVSVLGRYIPGRYWAAAAVAVMAKRMGVPPLIAMGSALLLTLINTIVGGCLLLGIGGPQLVVKATALPDQPIYTLLAPIMVLSAFAALLLLPIYLGPLVRLVSRITKREFHTPHLSTVSVLRSAGACAGAWVLYGIAFWIFCAALFGRVGAGPVDYVTVYTGSYLSGYVAVFTPSGFGVREEAIEFFLPLFDQTIGSAGPTIAAWSSRIWLTVLEVLPGVLLLLLRPAVGREENDKDPQAAGNTPGSASVQQR